MIENIFLMTWSNEAASDANKLTTQAAYPDENDQFNIPEIRNKIFLAHQNEVKKNHELKDFTEDFLRTNMIALTVDGQAILSVVLPFNNILGLVFPKTENPYDYRNELIRLFSEYFLIKFVENTKEKTKQTLLLTLFVDLRKYSDEFLAQQEEQNRIMYMGDTPLIKAFIFGLDMAGKSSLMRFLSTGKYDDNYFPPTKKFRITNVKIGRFKLVGWDMPGQAIFRTDWLRGAQASNILLFVLDSANTQRYEEARIELHRMLDLYELQGIPLLFLANKVDLLTTPVEIANLDQTFGLRLKNHRDVKIIPASIKNNIGIDEAIKWIEAKVENLLLTQKQPPPNHVNTK